MFRIVRPAVGEAVRFPEYRRISSTGECCSCYYWDRCSPQFQHSHFSTKMLYRNLIRGKTMGRWTKDQKERRKHELINQNAHLHAAVSVAEVAAAMAALVASSLTSPETSVTQPKAAI